MEGLHRVCCPEFAHELGAGNGIYGGLLTGVAKYDEEYIICSEAACGGDVAPPALFIGHILMSR